MRLIRGPEFSFKIRSKNIRYEKKRINNNTFFTCASSSQDGRFKKIAEKVNETIPQRQTWSKKKKKDRIDEGKKQKHLFFFACATYSANERFKR